MTTENKKYLIGRMRHRPGAIHIHQELHSVVPSGEAMSAAQFDFLSQGYPVGLRPRNRAAPHARYLTMQRQVFDDTGQELFFEVTDRPPPKTRKAATTEETLARMHAADLRMAEARVMASNWSIPTPTLTPFDAYLTGSNTTSVPVVASAAPVAIMDEAEEPEEDWDESEEEEESED